MNTQEQLKAYAELLRAKPEAPGMQQAILTPETRRRMYDEMQQTIPSPEPSPEPAKPPRPDPWDGFSYAVGLILVTAACWLVALLTVFLARMFFWPATVIVAAGMLGAFYLWVYRRGGR